MERKRFSVLFFIKRSKLLKNGEAPVRVRVTYDRLYVELQLKRSIKVPLWSQEKEKSTGKDRNSVELNHYIDALRVKFYQIYQDLELEGKIISARAIVNRYQGKDETFKTLYNVFKEHNDNCRKLIGTDYADITVKRERMKKMKADPYYNALQVKYAYAVTCHKAQGGQWRNVFLDQGYMTDEYLTPDYFRWLYTAFTRATGTLYLVNYPKEQIV